MVVVEDLADCLDQKVEQHYDDLCNSIPHSDAYWEKKLTVFVAVYPLYVYERGCIARYGTLNFDYLYFFKAFVLSD